MVDQELLKILRCPETLQELRLAEGPLISRLNSSIAAGSAKNRAGQTVTEALDNGLVRADGRFLYPIRKNIPVMLIEEAISLTAGD
jgi:uncharacterized protein YbaR (Trm112 family)